MLSGGCTEHTSGCSSNKSTSSPDDSVTWKRYCRYSPEAKKLYA